MIGGKHNSHLPRDDENENGHEEDAALAHENARVIAAVQTALQRMLVVDTLPPHGPLLTARPTLTLRFPQCPKAKNLRGMATNGPSATKIAAALDATAAVLSHSSRLPKTRVGLRERSEFWLQLLLASKAKGDDTKSQPEQFRQFVRWLMEKEENFPACVVLEFEELNEKQVRAVSQFFTGGNNLRRLEQQADFCRSVKFRLAFRNCKLSQTSLLLIQQLLDQVSIQSHDPPTIRRCRIHMLELSSIRHGLAAPQLEILAEILSKNYIYKLEEIKLDGIMPSPSSKDLLSRSKLIRAAFGVPGGSRSGAVLPIHRYSMPSQPPCRSLSLASASLGLEQAATIFSALRYGCVYEELSLASALLLLDVPDDSVRAECWWWIAFGLFYPRSESFASSFRLRSIDLSEMVLRTTEMTAFAKALANPVAESRRLGGNHGDRLDVSIIVCTLIPDATIYSAPDTMSKPLLMLNAEHIWEVLYVEGDREWLNVVVPGYGLGWVRAENVGNRKPQALVQTERLDLTMRRFRVPPLDYHLLDPFRVFMASVGMRARSLALQMCVGGFDLRILVDRCSGLEHLDLADNNLTAHNKLVELFQSIHRGCGSELTSLNLNNTQFDNDRVRELAELMKTPGCLPKLRELRLNNSWITDKALESLSSALEANRAVELVELQELHSLKARNLFDGKHNDEYLRLTTLPLRHRLALISAVTNTASTANAYNIMERWVFKQIFEFTGLVVQRKILWTKWYPPSI